MDVIKEGVDMKKKTLLLTVILLLGIASVLFLPVTDVSSAEEVAVIVNKDNPINELSVEEIRNFYENNKLKWSDGMPVVLFDLPAEHLARKMFSLSVLGKEADEVAKEWANRSITNTAKNPPQILSSDVLIQHRVGKDVLAIGYLPVYRVMSSRVKVVAIIR